jgi:hypothetical protein
MFPIAMNAMSLEDLKDMIWWPTLSRHKNRLR